MHTPPKLLKKLLSDPYYQQCSFLFEHYCAGKIEFHHAMTWAGRQCQELECILPICHSIHEQARNSEVKEKLDYLMFLRMTEEQIARFSKSIDFFKRYNYIMKKYSAPIPVEATKHIC